MADRQMRNLRLIEGQRVSIALRDRQAHRRFRTSSAVGRNRLDNLWLFVNGEDVFVARSDVIDLWQRSNDRPWAA